MTTASKSEHPTGAELLVGGGVHFSVWAPHADAVAVSGDFNDWASMDSAFALQRGTDDFWRGIVDDAIAGTEYKYLIRNGDRELSKNDPCARALTNSVGNSIVVDDRSFDWGDDHAFELPAWNQLVIYELHLGSFSRGEDQEVPGTFDDAIERLDHLVNLGINAIELMPVAEFAGDVSWGYNPAFPWAVESNYGGPDAFKRFVKTCHSKGLAVLLDVVYNHFGPSDLDLWRFDGWSENEYGGIYFYNDWRANTPWGATRPDYGRDEVRRYIRDNALMWLDSYHIDGLRFDMTFYMRVVDGSSELPEGWSLMQWINDDIAEQHPGALVIAEDLRTNGWITKGTEEGGAGFGAQWGEQFVHPVRKVLAIQEDEQRSMATICSAIMYSYNDDAFQRVIYTESHDEVANGKSRVPSEVDQYDQEGFWARKRSALGGCLVMTAPGIPMIFQGQELLATGHFEDDVELDWEKGYRHPGIVKLYRELIQLRTNRGGDSAALQSADTEILHVNEAAKVIVFSRGVDDEQIVVVMSFSQRQWDEYRVGFPQPGRWQLLFHSDCKKYSKDFGDCGQFDVTTEEVEVENCPVSATLELGTYDCLIFRFRG